MHCEYNPVDPFASRNCMTEADLDTMCACYHISTNTAVSTQYLDDMNLPHLVKVLVGCQMFDIFHMIFASG